MAKSELENLLTKLLAMEANAQTKEVIHFLCTQDVRFQMRGRLGHRPTTSPGDLMHKACNDGIVYTLLLDSIYNTMILYS